MPLVLRTRALGRLRPPCQLHWQDSDPGKRPSRCSPRSGGAPPSQARRARRAVRRRPRPPERQCRPVSGRAGKPGRQSRERDTTALRRLSPGARRPQRPPRMRQSRWQRRLASGQASRASPPRQHLRAVPPRSLGRRSSPWAFWRRCRRPAGAWAQARPPPSRLRASRACRSRQRRQVRGTLGALQARLVSGTSHQPQRLHHALLWHACMKVRAGSRGEGAVTSASVLSHGAGASCPRRGAGD
jgi:hypothetical protein